MHKENNFDFLRLVFALFVIITHSYALTGVSEENDVLSKLTNGALAFSTLGVSGFFIISGYLISESMNRSHSLGDYFLKRMLRIFPGFITVLLVGVVVGAFVSTVPFTEYFTNLDTLSYLLHNITMVNLQQTIYGVFEGNPLPALINGVLWTIPYEFLFYILLAFLFVFRHNRKVLLGLLLAAFCVVFAGHLLYTSRYYRYINVPYTSFNMSDLPHFGLYFAAGAILSAARIHSFRYRKHLLLGSLFLIVCLIAFGSLGAFRYVLLPPLIIIFALQATKGLTGIKGILGGDLSYGIYLYGWLIQQTLLHFFKLNAYELMIITMPIAMVCGYLSWNLIEKRPLKLKRRLHKAPVPHIA